METNFRYDGLVNIYLQGEQALETAADAGDHIHYFVVSLDSEISVDDYRAAVAEKMRSAMLHGDDGQFADAFSQPARISIQASNQSAHINIYEAGDQNTKTDWELWLGGIDSGTMAVRETMWELLKSVSDDCFAFAALAK